MRPAAAMAEWLRTAASLARALTLSAVRTLARVSARIRFPDPLPVLRFLLEASTIPAACEFEPTDSGTIVAGSAAGGVTNIRGDMRAYTILIGGGTLVRRSTTTGNTKLDLRTK